MTTTNKADEKRFNEALKRMLATPPKPHDHLTVAKKSQPAPKGAKKSAESEQKGDD